MKLSEAMRMIEERNRALERFEAALDITIETLANIAQTSPNKKVRILLDKGRNQYRELLEGKETVDA